MMSSIISGFRAIISIFWRREDKREREKLEIANELSDLADLFEEVLDATDAEGRINQEKSQELNRLRLRNWNRWITILESRKFENLPENFSNDIKDSIEIAYSAPGAYIKEILILKNSIAEGYIDKKTFKHFANSIDKLRDISVKLKLE